MTTKYATSGLFGKLMQDPHFWAPAIALTAGTALTAGASAVKNIVDARQKATSFKEMMDLHPQLKQRDPKFVQRVYSSLHNVNPVMARDPMVSGAWVDTIIESGGLDQGAAGRALLEGVKDLAQIGSHMSRRDDNSGPRAMGAALSNQISHGFNRAKELEKEVGDLGAAHQQIKDIQESYNRKEQNNYQRDLTRAFAEAEQKIVKAHDQGRISPDQIQSLVDAVAAKYKTSSDKSTGKLRKLIGKKC
jgi:hypothetical protein